MSRSAFANRGTHARLALAGSVLLLGGVSDRLMAQAGVDPVPVAQAGALHVPSPDWRDQIVYSLMIDRFDDGDATNNDQGANVYRRNADPYFNGGDLAGITRRVPYLKELGVTAVWVSPPTATQWWDPATQYSGYHGYWPVHFKEIDAHFGTIDDYRNLSRTLHGNGMYLIQDVVVNQVGHFYNYAGGHDPADKRKNFNLNTGAIPPAPRMYPFNLVNLLDAQAAKANVYHWSPTITDYADPAQQFTHQLQLMNDLNTSSPLVRTALKDAYGFWIKDIGVDAMRVDAAKHVEPDFLQDFVHGPGGIHESAKATGRHDFLTFGEIFNFSDPMAMNGETEIIRFMGTAGQPQLDSVINFPLNHEIRQAFVVEKPTSLMAYRLREQARQFAGSGRWPTFVNNHDVQRFLAEGTREAYRLAYLLLMTAPGIPVIYQGDELGFTEIRKPVFGGTDGEGSGAFDTGSADFRFLQSAIALRRQHAALRRGTLTTLQESPVAPGVLAFRRDLDGESLFVLFNTASAHSALVNALPVGHRRLETLFSVAPGDRKIADRVISADDDGRLTMVLPPSSALVLRGMSSAPGPASQVADRRIDLDRPQVNSALRSGESVCGHTASSSDRIQLVVDGNFDRPLAVPVGENGRWCARLPATGLDPRSYSAEFFDPALNVATPLLLYTGQGNVARQVVVNDPDGDDRGPTGRYQMLTDAPHHHAADIRAITARLNDEELELTIRVGEISNVWNYLNKFDHASFTVFIDSNPDAGAADLPGLYHSMPGGTRWDVSHRLSGMGSVVYSAVGADRQDFGTPLPGRPYVHVDHEHRQITMRYSRAALGVETWENAKIYVVSWDADEFGRYRRLGEAASGGQIGGGAPTDPHVLDDILLSLSEHQVP